MKGDKYVAKIDGLMVKNRLLVICMLVMLAFLIVTWIGMARMQSATQVVIMVPGERDGVKVGDGAADERYIRRMARYIVSQVGTYSAGSARYQYQELLDLFPPDRVTGAAKTFDSLAAEIERFPSIASNAVWIGDPPLKYTSNMIQVHVLKERLINGNVSERKDTHYCLSYHIDGSRFWLDNIEEKEEAGEDLCMLDTKPVAPDAAAAATH